MKFNFKMVFIIIVSIILILSYYFFTHFPIGTFYYSNQKNGEFTIKIQISEQLGTMFEPVYNMSVKIKNGNHLFVKKFETCDDNLNLLLLRRENKEFVILENSWSGYCKCESNQCSDFFQLSDREYSKETITNQSVYFTNYRDSIEGDTIEFVKFEELKFRNIK